MHFKETKHKNNKSKDNDESGSEELETGRILVSGGKEYRVGKIIGMGAESICYSMIPIIKFSDPCKRNKIIKFELLNRVTFENLEFLALTPHIPDDDFFSDKNCKIFFLLNIVLEGEEYLPVVDDESMMKSLFDLFQETKEDEREFELLTDMDEILSIMKLKWKEDLQIKSDRENEK